jgi:arabinosyltransferase C
VLAACTVTIFLIFRDQTFAAEIQASTFKAAVGPSLSWFDEHIRYERLFMATPDGSVARRFGVLTLLLALAVSVAMSLRKGRIPGTAAGPSRRIIGITVISFLAMMFTPTKWTHHFGVFAGLAGSLGALAAVAVTAAAMKSRRNRAMFAAAVLFVMALSFASVNGWWYVSNFSVPWSNAFPEWHFGFTTMLLGLAVVALLVAAWFHFYGRDRSPPDGDGRRLTDYPVAIGNCRVAVVRSASLTLGMTDSVRRGLSVAPTWARSPVEVRTGRLRDGRTESQRRLLTSLARLHDARCGHRRRVRSERHPHHPPAARGGRTSSNSPTSRARVTDEWHRRRHDSRRRGQRIPRDCLQPDRPGRR